MKKPVYSIIYGIFIYLFVIACITLICKWNCVKYNFAGERKNIVLAKDNAPTYSKEVFLTFDDGPSVNNTTKILNILQQNGVKATFFIVGEKAKENPSILKQISDSGMSIGVHTYSHNYKEMYSSLDAYLEDFQVCKNIIKNITGKDSIIFVRLPGGSDNLAASVSNLNIIKKTLKGNGMKYVDWNVVSGDADKRFVPKDIIKQNVIDGCKDKKIAVVLMHDSYYKTSTVEALPDIISYLKKEGFAFRTFDGITLEEEFRMRDKGIINR
ncbi:polysaccharide deacetylase family protein [Clostridium sp. AWRP]|uniref:polysaccharide deacetylase family protein n=1 Tax=Clostridium sp. AWRP TaxID=2212991 RepID=UPI000FD6E59C|nr:polysaccharide deacetylase family protein [Clostridium sp. AWRP]AZV55625.1 polysaccharide deacetylase [Clostridium sp. AWRP]